MYVNCIFKKRKILLAKREGWLYESRRHPAEAQSHSLAQGKSHKKGRLQGLAFTVLAWPAEASRTWGRVLLVFPLHLQYCKEVGGLLARLEFMALVKVMLPRAVLLCVLLLQAQGGPRERVTEIEGR